MKVKKVTAIILITALMIVFTACGNTAEVKDASTENFQPVQSVQNIDEEEAANVVKNMIRVDYTQYELNMVDDNFYYNGNQYYQFAISDIQPSIIVSKFNGSILCYYPDKTVTEVYEDTIFKSKC